MNNVLPHMTMLTEEQKHEVHQYTMKILETTGVRVDSPSALEMLKKTAGSSLVEEGPAGVLARTRRCRVCIFI